MGRTPANLQALRGAACLAVVVYHVAQAEAGYGLGVNPLKPARWLGVAAGAVGYFPGTPGGRMAVSPFVLEFMTGALLAWWPARWSGKQAAGLALTAAAWVAVGSALAYRPDPNWLPTAHWPRVLVFGP